MSDLHEGVSEFKFISVIFCANGSHAGEINYKRNVILYYFCQENTIWSFFVINVTHSLQCHSSIYFHHNIRLIPVFISHFLSSGPQRQNREMTHFAMSKARNYQQFHGEFWRCATFNINLFFKRLYKIKQKRGNKQVQRLGQDLLRFFCEILWRSRLQYFQDKTIYLQTSGQLCTDKVLCEISLKLSSVVTSEINFNLTFTNRKDVFEVDLMPWNFGTIYSILRSTWLSNMKCIKAFPREEYISPIA